jgi:hypothetical protein
VLLGAVVMTMLLDKAAEISSSSSSSNFSSGKQNR